VFIDGSIVGSRWSGDRIRSRTCVAIDDQQRARLADNK
jgi:hypothetical protein